MYLIKVLLNLPFDHAYKMYSHTSFEYSFEKTFFNFWNFAFTAEKIDKSDPRFSELLEQLPGHRLKEQLQPFLNKMGIREDLFINQTSNRRFCTAKGTNIFLKGDARILVDSELPGIDNDAYHWLIKRKISYIKYNDGFTMNFIPAVCSTAACILGARSLSFFRTAALVYIVTEITDSSFSRWRNAKSDNFAIENSSIEELKGARRFLLALQEINILQHHLGIRTMTAKGNDLSDLKNPTLTSRIRKIEKVLQAREVKIDEEERTPILQRYVIKKWREQLTDDQRLYRLFSQLFESIKNSYLESIEG